MKCLTRSFLVIAVLSASSCDLFKSNESSCGPEAGFDESDFIHQTAFEAVTSPHLGSSLAGGRRIFSWSRVIENVCSEEHARANWFLMVDTNRLPPGWQVEAGYFISALTGSDLTLTPSDNANIRSYSGETEIGLSQAFDDGPGRFLVYLDISFTSQGDLVHDRGLLQQALFRMQIQTSYKLHKSN